MDNYSGRVEIVIVKLDIVDGVIDYSADFFSHNGCGARGRKAFSGSSCTSSM